MKKILSLFCLSLFALFISIGCAHQNKVEYKASAGVENEKGGITLRPAWLKNKRNTVDLLLGLSNGYNDDVVIKESSFILEYDGQKFPVTNNLGDLTLRGGLSYEKLFIFKMPDTRKREGQVVLHVDPITKNGKKVRGFALTLPLSR